MSKRQELKETIQFFSKKGDYVSAIPPMEQYLALIKEEFGDSSDRHVTILNDLGGMYRNVGDFKKAEQTFELARDIIEKKLGKHCEQYATTTVNLACIFRFIKEFDKAEKLFLEAMDIYHAEAEFDYLIQTNNCERMTSQPKHKAFQKAELERKSELYANACNNIGVLYQDMQKFEEATAYHTQSLIFLDNADNPEYMAITINNLVNPLIQMQQFNKAIEMINKSLLLFETHLSQEHPLYLTAFNNLGAIYYHQQDYANALDCFEQAKQCIEKHFSKDSPQYASCLNNIEAVKQAQDKSL